MASENRNGNLSQGTGPPFLFSHVLQLRLEIVIQTQLLGCSAAKKKTKKKLPSLVLLDFLWRKHAKQPFCKSNKYLKRSPVCETVAWCSLWVPVTHCCLLHFFPPSDRNEVKTTFFQPRTWLLSIMLIKHSCDI